MVYIVSHQAKFKLVQKHSKLVVNANGSPVRLAGGETISIVHPSMEVNFIKAVPVGADLRTIQPQGLSDETDSIISGGDYTLASTQ